MKKDKIGTIFLVSILALAGIGVSFAGLTDTIHVYGTVSTATVDLVIEGYSGTWVWKVWCNDPTQAPDGEIVVTHDPDYDPIADYPDCQRELISFAEGRDPTDDDPPKEDDTPYDAVIEFDNLFPCIDFMADIVFHYVGSIPAKLTYDWGWTGQGITLPDGTVITDDFIDWLMENGHMTGTIYKYNVDDREFNIPIDQNYQLHYCDLIKLIVTIHLPQQNWLQGLSGTGYVNFNLIQWNDQCDDDQQTGDEASCIKIMKTLEGSFTDPSNGGDLIDPTQFIALGADFPTKFKLTICVENCGETDLTDVLVTDIIGPMFTPTQWTSPDDVVWIDNELTWTITELIIGETTCLEIWLETILSVDEDVYEPTLTCLTPIWPTDGSIYHGINGDYTIENPTNNPFYAIKYETIGEGVKNGGYDIFEFILDQDPGTYQIECEAEGSTIVGIVTLENIGDTGSHNLFTFEFLSKTDNGDGTYTYSFKVTNDNNRALSHVSIGLPCGGVPPDMNFNIGATASVETSDCETLSATTEGITIVICCVDNDVGIMNPTLPYFTPWAEDSCNP